MPVNASAAYAIYPENAALNEIVQTLKQGGFEKESICMMLSPAHQIATTVRDSQAHTFERESQARTAGLIGWLSEFGAVLIPTFGFFIRSRAFFRALIAEQDCMTGKGRCGLVGLGFSENDAKRFENQVREVGALVYVSCPESSQTRCALELLRAAGAEEAGLLLGDARAEAMA